MPDIEKVICHLNDCIEASRRDNTWVFVRKDIVEDALELLKEQETVVRCKDCRFFAVKEHWAELGFGAKILCADNCPTCEKWGNGCKTDPEGYCFLGERKDE